MKACAYFCKYTPLELLRAFGVEPELIDDECGQFEHAETITHANLCSHAKMLIEMTRPEDTLILMDCCDSVRRACDSLRALDRRENILMVDLPHDERECARQRFARALEAFCDELRSLTGRSFDARRFAEACGRAQSSTGAAACAGQADSFYLVAGARASSALLNTISETLNAPVVDMTCGGNRAIEPMPRELRKRAFGADAQCEAQLFADLMEWYAGALLRQIPCMRMSDVSRRRELTERPGLAGVVYNTVKFCDYYGFDYMRLKDEVDVPILKIESDYRPLPPGQLSTRLEAFAETVTKQVGGRSFMGKRQPADTAATMRESAARPLFAGIDSGSTSTNMVVIDESGEIVASSIVRTGPKASIGAEQARREVERLLAGGDAKTAGGAAACNAQTAQASCIVFTMATGYGRANIPFADDTATEITCHGKGAHAIAPQVHTIVDIGGQDSKVICLDADGNVGNFVMNDKCAAGTGRFLEAMARTLEVDLPTLASKGLTWSRDLTISSMCTVFAESEVISLIADDHSDDDIIHGLNKSIASRTSAMVSRARGEAPFMMTGGVARNKGVVRELEHKLGADVFVWENPDLCGALGAALLARDAWRSDVLLFR